MYCKNCGAYVKDGSSFCGNCGHQLAPSDANEKPVGTHPYHQLGGWLAFITYGLLIGVVLVVVGAVLGALTLVRYASYLGSQMLLLGLVEIILYLPAVYFSLKMFQLIRQKDTGFLRFYELTMLMFGGIDVFLIFIGSTMGYISSNEHIKSLIQSAIIFAIWLIYFGKSVRVRTYFGSDDYLKNSIFLKNCQAPDPAVPDEEISRSGKFFEQIYQFTLPLSNMELFLQKIQDIPYSQMGISMGRDENQQFFRFFGATFEAQLWYRSHTADKSIYCFRFNQWKEDEDGTIHDIYEMNMLLTAIKKLFLSIDPAAQIKSWRI